MATKTKTKSTLTICSTQAPNFNGGASPYAGKRGVTRIHVNQQNIRSNKKNNSDLPVVTVKKGKQNVYGHIVEIAGPSVVVYSPHTPLGCGARVWVETLSAVSITERLLGGGLHTVELEGRAYVS
jgi:hypothetical protein